MEHIRLGFIEEQFANIIWDHAPISSGELVKLADATLGWRKSTTYTVLKRLGEKGLIQNEHGIVNAAISRTAYETLRSEQVVNEQFRGSLPAFIAAFTTRNALSAEDISEIRRMIDGMNRTPEGGDPQ